MRPAKSVGRIIGMLLFVQLVGLILPFILLLPMTTAGFLENAAGVALQIRVAVLLLFANSALTIGIAIAAFPVLREYGYRMALWLLVVSVIWFSMQAVDNAHILSMLSLSQRYAEGGASNAELFGALAAASRSSRVWAHYTELLVVETWFFVFYGVLFRLSLVPRPLAGFGMIMVILHAAGITLPMFIGYGSVPTLGTSLAFSHLAVGSWLVAKGFDNRRRTLPADERGVGMDQGDPMMSRVCAFAFFILAITSCAGRGPNPGPPTYLLKASLSDSGRTKVLILATDHLRALGKDFDRALLTPLIDALERFGPDAVAVEALPPEEIARLAAGVAAKPGGAAAELLAAFAEDAARYGREAQESLGLPRADASARADSLLAALHEPDVQARRLLALHLLAAYDLPSALVQWSYLPEEHRSAHGSMTPPIAGFLSRRLESPDEIVSIGVAVAHRRGLNRLLSVDDHVDDEVGLKTGLNGTLMRELEGNPAYAELVASSYIQEAQRRLPEAAKQGDLLPLYVRMNSPDYLNEDVSRQWHFFFRTELPSKIDRARVALWEARNLNIAGRIRSASAWHPGGRVLVVIGAAHKPFLDRYVAQMMDIEIVQLADVLRLKRGGRTGR